jgi:hypothetical protein
LPLNQPILLIWMEGDFLKGAMMRFERMLEAFIGSAIS